MTKNEMDQVLQLIEESMRKAYDKGYEDHEAGKPKEKVERFKVSKASRMLIEREFNTRKR